jgi:hypothetical protein
VQPGATAPPGWLVEGIADYYRWYVFQPEMRGAEISSERAGEARFDAGYRPSANFLNWVGKQHGTDLVPKMNAVIRQGRYRDELWKDWTGHALSELGEQWKSALIQQ